MHLDLFIFFIYKINDRKQSLICNCRKTIYDILYLMMITFTSTLFTILPSDNQYLSSREQEISQMCPKLIFIFSKKYFFICRWEIWVLLVMKMQMERCIQIPASSFAFIWERYKSIYFSPPRKVGKKCVILKLQF